MITALVLLHLFGGGEAEIFSSSDIRMVGRNIEDIDRTAVVTQAMERMNERFTSILELRGKYFEQLSEIDHNVNSREGAYDKVFDELWQARGEARQKYIEDIFIMRENMTRDEWQAAFGDTEL